MRTYFKMDITFEIDGIEFDAAVKGYTVRYMYGEDADGNRGEHRTYMEFQIIDLKAMGQDVLKENWYDYEDEIEDELWKQIEDDTWREKWL